MLAVVVAAFFISAPSLLTGPNYASAEPAITLSPSEGRAGTMVDVDGSGFVPLSIITITFDRGNMQTRPDTISADALGNFSANFEVPHSIDSGTYQVVANGHGITRVSASSTFTVSVPNNPPVAVSQAVSVDQDKDLDISLKGSDPDGDLIAFSIVDEPAHGTISEFNPGSGSLKFTPSRDYEGDDRFTFNVNDGKRTSFLGEVSIRILGLHSGPRMEDMLVQAEEDNDLTIFLRATDVDSPSLTFNIVESPKHGSLDFIRPYDAASSYVTYTPHPDFNGTDSFTAKASDTRFESETATITVNVTGVQDRPKANGAVIVANSDDKIEVTLTAFDPDGDTLVYTVESLPAHGSISGTAPNLIYLPSDYRGWDSFTFKVNDGLVDSDTARIEVKVEQATSTEVPSSSGTDADDSTAEEPEVTPPKSTIPPTDEPVPPVVQTPPVAEPIPNEPVDAGTPIGQENSGSDTEAPRIIFPASTLVFDSQSEVGTTVTYNIVAIDAADGEIRPECSPGSGSRFPVGRVNVVCTASDSAGNSALGSFTIEVRLLPGEAEKASPLSLDKLQSAIPELQFAVMPFIIATVVGIALAIGLKVAKKNRTKSSRPQQSST